MKQSLIRDRRFWLNLVFCLTLILTIITLGAGVDVVEALGSKPGPAGDLEGPWEVLAGVEWQKRYGHTTLVLPDGSIVMMGGHNGAERLNDVWRSTDGGETWSIMTANAEWSPRSGHASVLLNDGSILVIGGNDGSRRNDVWRSTDKGATWTQKTASAAWSARDDFAAVVIPSDGSILLMGGNDDETSYHYYKNDVWRSTNGGGTWSLVVAEAEWDDRRSHAAVALSDDTIVIMAGKTRGQTSIGGVITGSYDLTLANVFISTDKGATWTQKASLPKAVGGHASVVMADDTIIVTGGHYYSPVVPVQDYYRDDVYVSTNKGETWETVNDDAPWNVRAEHTSVVLANGKLLLLGGYSGSVWNDIWQSSDDGATWNNTACAEWSQRHGHTSVLLPDGSILLMGGSNTSRKNDVWRSTDKGETWTLVTDEAPWDERHGHTSVVLSDGSIVLMGGYAFPRRNDVWRSTDQGATWTQMTGAAAWSARDDHSTVVLQDGSIVLMGGYDGSYANDVWRSTDSGATWSKIADASWSGRENHTSVVLSDGTIVLMGGATGYDDEDLLNDVWQSTDGGVTWTLVTEHAEWSARSAHASVVLQDGTIVLMGGGSSTGGLNDVWTSTDGGASWDLLMEHAEWSGRNNFTAVTLADDGVLVMGGYGSYLNDVWRLGGRGSSGLLNFVPIFMID